MDLVGTIAFKFQNKINNKSCVAGLDSVRDLGRASFHQTVVTRKQLKTIEKAFRSLAYFDVRQE